MEFRELITLLVITILSVYFMQAIADSENQCPPCPNGSCSKPNCSTNETAAKFDCDCCEHCYRILGKGEECRRQLYELDIPVNVEIGVCNENENLTCQLPRSFAFVGVWTCEENSTDTTN